MKTKEQLCVEFVEEFVKHGFRIDTYPTRPFNLLTSDTFGAQMKEYAWWSDYVRSAESRLLAMAKQALSGNGTN